MEVRITPTLIVTDDEDAETVDALTAYEKIKGFQVMRYRTPDIPRVRSLDAARDVMTLLGMSERMQDDRIHFALTGEILGAC